MFSRGSALKKKEKLKWVLVIGRLKFQGQLIARNDTLLRCFLFKEWLWLMGSNFKANCKKKKLCRAAFCFQFSK